MAVPVMTSFAVQVITSTIEYISNKRLHNSEKKHGKKTKTPTKKEREKPFLSHSELVVEAYDRVEKVIVKEATEYISRGNDSAVSEKSDHESTKSQKVDETLDLTEHVLDLATKLERHARRLLVGHLSKSTSVEIINAGMLLKADWNVQRREVKALLDYEPDPEYEMAGDPLEVYHDQARFDLHKGVTKEKDTLEEVTLYRECFAELLAAGARLKKLEGSKRLLFERRRGKGEQPSDASSTS
jgi:potassium channel subfamily K, other eukaryote